MALPLFAIHCASYQLRKRTVRLVVFTLCILPILTARASHAQNTINTFAGGGSWIPSGNAALDVELPGPTAAIRDAAGNTYIAAPYSYYVFDVKGGLATIFAGTGVSGYAGDGKPAANATLGLPSGLSFDRQGNIYIADPKDSRIRMVAAGTFTISTVAGGAKCAHPKDTCGDGGPAVGAGLNLPLGVAVDHTGIIYIADAYDNRIRAVNPTSSQVTVFGVPIGAGDIATIAGTGVVCSNPTAKCGDGGLAISASLNYPESVALDKAGNLLIADTRDNRIRKVSPFTARIDADIGAGDSCKTPTGACGDNGPALRANLTMPTSLFLDASNNIYIADSSDQKVRFVNSGTTEVTVFGVPIEAGDIGTVAGNGTACGASATAMSGACGNGGAATSAWLNYPNSVFLDSSGNLVIADTGDQSVRQVVSSGIISAVAGGGSGGNGGSPTNAVLANPNAVAEDSAGNIFFAEPANNWIRAINMGTQTVTLYGVAIPAGSIATVAGTGIAGTTGDGGPGTVATLNGPTTIALDASNNMYIADAGNLVIRKLDPSGTINLFAGTYGKVCAGGPPPTCGDGGPATSAWFNTPQSVAVDSSDNVYVADYNADTIREITASNGNIQTIAGNGTGGVQICPSAPTPATQVSINHPSAIAVDSAGNVYVDDSYANTACKISGGMISNYALDGKSTYAGDGGPALSASEFFPLTLALDPGTNLFIGGGNSNCARRVDFVTYTIGTVVGDVGQGCLAGFAGDGGPATSAEISSAGFMVDANSNLYIADAGNNRIRLVTLTPSITTAGPPNFGAWPIGKTSGQETLTVTSSGGIDLDLTALGPIGGRNPNDFSVVGSTCTTGTSMGVDETCTVTFTFTPLNYGSRTATYQISDNGPGSPQSVTLSGFGPYFTISASPNTLTISPGSQANSTLTIAPQASFTGLVNLSCTTPSGLTCSLSQQSVTLDGVDSATVTLTFTVGSSTLPGTYDTSVTGTFGSSGQLQIVANIRVVVP